METDYSSLLEYNNSIRGKTMIDPLAIASFTDVMRDKFTRMMTALSNDDEDTYVMSIADPFHPQSQGARIPELVPRLTQTFTAFTEATSIPSADGEFIFVPFHPVGDVQFMTISGTVAPVLAAAQPTIFTATRKGADYSVEGLNLGLGNTLAQANRLRIFRSSVPGNSFTKQRIVGAGLRVFKTSKSDTESG